MQTTFKEQFEAIRTEMLQYEITLKETGVDYTTDRHWKALNDAASTIAFHTLKPSPESVTNKAKEDPLI